MEYDKVDLIYDSIQKNIQELCETLVYDFNIDNYYDLIDRLYFLNNMCASLYKNDKKLFNKIKKEIESV